jgi:hypothetical protein
MTRVNSIDDLPPRAREQARRQLAEQERAKLNRPAPWPPPPQDKIDRITDEPKPSKYHNVKITTDDGTFDSKREYAIADPSCLRNDKMNKTEAAYADVLAADKTIAWWRFGALVLRIGEKCFYHTDFFLMRTDGRLEIHETKGFMRDDAQVKLRAIREMYPFFRLAVVKKAKAGAWEYDWR